MRVEHGHVDLLLLHILLSHTLQGKQPVRLRAPQRPAAGSQAVAGGAGVQAAQALTGSPARSRLRAMPAPIVPSPRTATRPVPGA
jgi:hypothetical protein